MLYWGVLGQSLQELVSSVMAIVGVDYDPIKADHQVMRDTLNDKKSFVSHTGN